jgi:hypothetical protein
MPHAPQLVTKNCSTLDTSGKKNQRQTKKNLEKNSGEGPEKPGIDLRLYPQGSCRQNQMESPCCRPKHQSAQKEMNELQLSLFYQSSVFNGHMSYTAILLGHKFVCVCIFIVVVGLHSFLKTVALE